MTIETVINIFITSVFLARSESIRKVERPPEVYEGPIGDPRNPMERKGHSTRQTLHSAW